MTTTTASGLQYEDVVVGDGAEATAGKYVTVHYTGWLYENGQAGKKFDSSKDRNDPVSYTHLTLPTKEDECRSRWSPYH